MMQVSEVDVIAAWRFIESVPGVQADRIAVIGASYSREEMAEAGRIIEHARAYVALLVIILFTIESMRILQLFPA